ncbi:hypothetical protein PAHAL_2G098200 [Panicum hallii]|uniref:Uncharacterized protein n=1 Tax=Panicum hallii TaxID=206008 RepID=A0A2S3GX56_9POAL|nr:hypothetical protein PAHAL_2G098200 [Panicum hallii]
MRTIVQPTLWTRRACGAAFVDQEEAAVSARDLSHVLGSLSLTSIWTTNRIGS